MNEEGKKEGQGRRDKAREGDKEGSVIEKNGKKNWRLKGRYKQRGEPEKGNRIVK